MLVGPVVVLLVFEEWGWEPLARAFAALGRLAWWGALERWITRLPPWASLLVFGLPAILLIPIKLLALYLFGRGHFVLGLCMVVSAKVAGTAIAARLFQLTHPALMRMPWFARWYTPWKIWKDAMFARVRASQLWAAVRRVKRLVKTLMQTAWQRFKAILTVRRQ